MNSVWTKQDRVTIDAMIQKSPVLIFNPFPSTFHASFHNSWTVITPPPPLWSFSIDVFTLWLKKKTDDLYRISRVCHSVSLSWLLMNGCWMETCPILFWEECSISLLLDLANVFLEQPSSSSFPTTRGYSRWILCAYSCYIFRWDKLNVSHLISTQQLTSWLLFQAKWSCFVTKNVASHHFFWAICNMSNIPTFFY